MGSRLPCQWITIQIFIATFGLFHIIQGIVLRGPYSGQIYRFSRDAATAVFAEDVGALLRTGALERVKP